MNPVYPPLPRPVRAHAIAGWATATMLSVAAFTLLFLVHAFVPLVEMWAVRQVASSGGGTPAAVASLVRLIVLALLALAYAATAVSFVVWLSRARRNLAAFVDASPKIPKWYAVAVWFVPLANLVTPPVVVADVARATTPRRRSGGLVWGWWLLFLGGWVALIAGVAITDAGRTELGQLRGSLESGDSVDRSLAAQLLGEQVAARLPAAALWGGAAVCLIVLVSRVTEGQYGRFDALRGAAVGAAPVPARVVVPAQPGPARSDGAATVMLPERRPGATI